MTAASDERRGRLPERRRSVARTVSAGTVQAPWQPPMSNGSTAPTTAVDEPLGDEAFRSIDRIAIAWVALLTGGISPTAMGLAFMDWSIHMAAAPGKRAELVIKALRKTSRLLSHATARAVLGRDEPCIEPLPGDRRFQSESWRAQPFAFWQQAFLLTQQWWHNATHEVPGVSPHHEDLVSFVARQMLDVFSPSNFLPTNPELLARTWETHGANLQQGLRNLVEDTIRLATHAPHVGTERFVPGREVALTPGTVVFRNGLVEVIQYAPATPDVHAEPVLIVPAWIMKYYILDLSPGNSLIRHLVDNGHTVFCMSWRNPTGADRDISLDDYRRLGLMEAIDAVSAIVPGRGIHGVGYCLGGTLLAIAAAAMGRAGDRRLASVTLFAAQTDFSEPGELGLFIDHSALHMLDSLMWLKGYLSADQMAGAFQLLRSNDLIWSHNVREYMMGERPAISDLMAWNADATRLPYRMHAQYLQSLYLDNALAAGHLKVAERAVSLQNIRVPMFVVGAEQDHVAPWRSVYKVHNLTDTDVTFVLTNGGHNAGIVSEPGHPGRHFRIATKHADGVAVGPDDWTEATAPVPGTWWPAWIDWLDRTGPTRSPPPGVGAPGAGYPPLCAAPGQYVFG